MTRNENRKRRTRINEEKERRQWRECTFWCHSAMQKESGCVRVEGGTPAPRIEFQIERIREDGESRMATANQWICVLHSL